MPPVNLDRQDQPTHSLGAPLSLFHRLLQDNWNQLTKPLQHFHGSIVPAEGYGVFRVRNGEKFYGRLLARILRLPLAGNAIPVRLRVTPHAGGERWERIFGDHSVITEDREYPGLLLAERFLSDGQAAPV